MFTGVKRSGRWSSISESCLSSCGVGFDGAMSSNGFFRTVNEIDDVVLKAIN